MTEAGEPLQLLQCKIATPTAGLREWPKLATEIAEELKVSQADVILQSRLWEAARDAMDAETMEATKRKERLATSSVELLQLSEKNLELTDEVGRMKSQHANRAIVLDYLKSVVGTR